MLINNTAAAGTGGNGGGDDGGDGGSGDGGGEVGTTRVQGTHENSWGGMYVYISIVYLSIYLSCIFILI
jgi:hypothetical protein